MPRRHAAITTGSQAQVTTWQNNRGFCHLFTNPAAQRAFGCGGGHPACDASLCHIAPCGPDLLGSQGPGACFLPRKGKPDKPILAKKYPNCATEEEGDEAPGRSQLVGPVSSALVPREEEEEPIPDPWSIA